MRAIIYGQNKECRGLGKEAPLSCDKDLHLRFTDKNTPIRFPPFLFSFFLNKKIFLQVTAAVPLQLIQGDIAA